MIYSYPSQGKATECGSIAQLGEHLPYKQRVIGSSPIVSIAKGKIFANGPVVQLVRTLACHARGQGFESPSGRHFVVSYASVAQLVEQGTENPRVVGSIPIGGTTKCGFSSFGRARPCQGRGGGFEPRNPLQKRSNFCLSKVTSFFIQAAGLAYHHASACISSAPLELYIITAKPCIIPPAA